MQRNQEQRMKSQKSQVLRQTQPPLFEKMKSFPTQDPFLMTEQGSEILLPRRKKLPADLGPERSENHPGDSDQDPGPFHQDTISLGHPGGGHALPTTQGGEGHQG